VFNYGCNKETVVDEDLTFESWWIEGYFLICMKGAVVPINCDENIPVLKEHNIKKFQEMKSASQLSGIRQLGRG
jgi:hypothetical protein